MRRTVCGDCMDRSIVLREFDGESNPVQRHVVPLPSRVLRHSVSSSSLSSSCNVIPSLRVHQRRRPVTDFIRVPVGHCVTAGGHGRPPSPNPAVHQSVRSDVVHYDQHDHGGQSAAGRHQEFVAAPRHRPRPTTAGRRCRLSRTANSARACRRVDSHSHRGSCGVVWTGSRCGGRARRAGALTSTLVAVLRCVNCCS